MHLGKRERASIGGGSAGSGGLLCWVLKRFNFLVLRAASGENRERVQFDSFANSREFGAIGVDNTYLPGSCLPSDTCGSDMPDSSSS